MNKDATFLCTPTLSAILSWTVNGSLIHHLFENISADIHIHLGAVSTLTIKARAEYNNTVVRCIAEEKGRDNTGYQESDTATLLIQGTCTCVHMYKQKLCSTCTCTYNYTYMYIMCCTGTLWDKNCYLIGQ